VWDASTGKLLRTFPESGYVLSLTFSPDGRSLAVGGGEGGARLWDVRTGKLLVTMRAPSWFFTALAITPDGKTLLAGHTPTASESRRDAPRQGTFRVWDVATGRERRSLSGPPF